METQIWKTKDIFSLMEEWAPKHFAYDWDNVGMQIGSFHKPVRKVMITLDVLESVVDEAIEQQVDLIIAHHPLLFKPMKQVNIDQSKGRMIQKLLKHHITVYAAHTNLDIANGGVNDLLFDALDIHRREVFLETSEDTLYKLAVYVPETYKQQVMDALNDSGVGHIGQYSHCSFQTKGYGTFKPLEGTNPFIGTENKLEQVEEIKLETIVEQSNLQKAVRNMVDAHPYEEVAYDIYRLENKGKVYGLGRVGFLNEEMSLQSLCEHMKQSLQIPALRVGGDLKHKVKKIAIVGGSGENYIRQAIQQEVDVLITGDTSFHNVQDAVEMGLHIIDPGHHVEKVMIEGVKIYLDKKLKGTPIEVITSKVSTEPFQFI